MIFSTCKAARVVLKITSSALRKNNSKFDLKIVATTYFWVNLLIFSFSYYTPYLWKLKGWILAAGTELLRNKENRNVKFVP